jgi:signal transduction protein with GAF and PtsI domain
LSAVVLMCYSVKGRVVLKAKALEDSDAKLERFEERLEKLMQEIDRAGEEIRNEIRRTKLMILIGFTALIALSDTFKVDKVLIFTPISSTVRRSLSNGCS